MKNNHVIAVLPGDGIGNEVISEALRVIERVEQLFGHSFRIQEYDVGGTSIEKHGCPLTEETLEACKKADAVFLGAVGGPRWDSLPLPDRPETALLTLRKELNCFANLRPVKLTPALCEQTILQPHLVSAGVDIMIVRELLHGLYYGDRGTYEMESGGKQAFDTAVYPEAAIQRVAHFAFRLAQRRKRKVTSLDKSNILATSRLWRETVTAVSKEYSDCTLEHQIIDRAAMQILTSPTNYDVILVNNEYGDIISEEASVLAVSVGMIPSASLGTTPPFLFEPIHGSAPDIVGKAIANPTAAILSAALVLRFSFGYEEEADAIDNSVDLALERGLRTKDIALPGEAVLTTSEFTAGVLEALSEAVEHRR